ncbi:MAG: dicarboxylate/amino acid:cation symporter, partial [Pseudopedobacter saltans]
MKEKKSQLTLYILIAMVLGALLGYIVYYKAMHSLEAIAAGDKFNAATLTQGFADKIKLLTTIFLRLIQMIISPLVFCTLAVGIAKLGDMKSVGRVGGRAMLWFISASLVSLALGTLLVNLFQPGHAIDINSNVNHGSASDIISHTQEFSLQSFIEHVFPKSVI